MFIMCRHNLQDQVDGCFSIMMWCKTAEIVLLCTGSRPDRGSGEEHDCKLQRWRRSPESGGLGAARLGESFKCNLWPYLPKWVTLRLCHFQMFMSQQRAQNSLKKVCKNYQNWFIGLVIITVWSCNYHSISFWEIGKQSFLNHASRQVGTWLKHILMAFIK